MRKTRLLLLLLAAAACEKSAFVAETALEAPVKLNGCCVGDLDPRKPGNEIVAVGMDGSVFLIWREEGAWKHETIARAKGELLQCAIGGVDPAGKRNTLVVCGMKEGPEDGAKPGAVHAVAWDGAQWTMETIFEDTALVHGVCTADMDPALPGEEILAVGFSSRATVIARDGDGWKVVPAGGLPGPGKAAVAYKLGAAVVTASGHVVHITRNEAGWKHEVLDAVEAGQARIGTDGKHVLAARDDGKLGLITGVGEREDIYGEGAKLRGAVLAELDGAAGAEAATAGYEGRVTVLYRREKGWTPVTVFTDTEKFHHLTSGELIGGNPGVELVACGYSKKVVVIRHQ